MAMNQQQADKAVITSALVVFGVYFYRHLTEGTDNTSGGGVGQLLGLGTPANIGKFVTTWGFVFFVLSILAEAAPPLGGSFAILVAAGDVLANATNVAKDINTKLGESSSGSGGVSTGIDSATSSAGTITNDAGSVGATAVEGAGQTATAGVSSAGSTTRTVTNFFNSGF